MTQKPHATRQVTHEEGLSLRTLPTESDRASRVRRPETKRPRRCELRGRVGSKSLTLFLQRARVAKLVDAADFKSEAVRGNCGFESRHGQSKI